MRKPDPMHDDWNDDPWNRDPEGDSGIALLFVAIVCVVMLWMLLPC